MNVRVHIRLHPFRSRYYKIARVNGIDGDRHVVVIVIPVARSLLLWLRRQKSGVQCLRVDPHSPYPQSVRTLPMLTNTDTTTATNTTTTTSNNSNNNNDDDDDNNNDNNPRKPHNKRTKATAKPASHKACATRTHLRRHEASVPPAGVDRGPRHRQTLAVMAKRLGEVRQTNVVVGREQYLQRKSDSRARACVCVWWRLQGHTTA